MGKNQDPRSGINIPDPQHWLSDKVLQVKIYEDEGFVCLPSSAKIVDDYVAIVRRKG
jgi:hypothetical protein